MKKKKISEKGNKISKKKRKARVLSLRHTIKIKIDTQNRDSVRKPNQFDHSPSRQSDLALIGRRPTSEPDHRVQWREFGYNMNSVNFYLIFLGIYFIGGL